MEKIEKAQLGEIYKNSTPAQLSTPPRSMNDPLVMATFLYEAQKKAENNESAASVSDGSKLAGNTRRPKFCRECGTKFENDSAKFCSVCGARIITVC